jgi:hypothetical protein
VLSSRPDEFQTALAAHAQAPDAFETARTRLLYGGQTAPRRAAGRRGEQLRVALDAFTALDLTAWAQRAADELAATGATARPRRPLTGPSDPNGDDPDQVLFQETPTGCPRQASPARAIALLGQSTKSRCSVVSVVIVSPQLRWPATA